MPRAPRRQTLFVIVFLMVVVWFMTNYRLAIVRGKSMEPTYVDGQVVLVRRNNWFRHPVLHRFDVILVRKDRDVIIKRVYRLPGEELDTNEPDVLSPTLRKERLADYYEQQPVIPHPGVKIRLFVPSKFLVLLGDNLKGSEDSRIFGPVPMRDVLGTVVDAPLPLYATASANGAAKGSR